MSKKHLLWWVFKFLAERHPMVLNEMIAECDGEWGDNASSTVNRELNAALERFYEARDEDDTDATRQRTEKS